MSPNDDSALEMLNPFYHLNLVQLESLKQHFLDAILEHHQDLQVSDPKLSSTIQKIGAKRGLELVREQIARLERRSGLV